MVSTKRTSTESVGAAPPPHARGLKNERGATREVVGELVDERKLAAERQLRNLAWLLDESIEIPGLRWRIGLDGLIGLIPGVGDLIATGLSAMIIRQAAILGVPRILLARMACNTLLDLILGAIPVVGDLFDFAWKANRRNANLALQHLHSPRRARNESWLTVGGMLALLIGSLVAVGALVGGVTAALLGAG